MVRGDSGGMNSPYSGESASPYSSDQSFGVPSPPTVVAAFNRPYDAVHYDGPHIQILEQPQSKFRFRYKSEMVGTHGQLKADRADKNRAVFPTVKLAKWDHGPAVIRLALYTAEDNVNQRKRHVHELSGKNCDKETGICEVVVDEKCDYTAVFQNLGIIHIAKRDTREIIMQRKREELIAHARLRKPNFTCDEIRRSITPTDIKKMDDEAEEEAKNMDLNKVVLRFQAFQYDKSIESYRPITLPVDSEVVFNLKNATTGELKIVRMSACSAPCTGGTEIWLLVEKVRRNYVQIKFFELDENDREVWTAYGEFTDADVHHQYAIVFRTPPYRYTNLNTSVRVKIQLERPTDRDTSEPLDFTYLPDSLKRQRVNLENTLEEGKRRCSDHPAKRFNYSQYANQAIDLSSNMRNGRGQEDSTQNNDILAMFMRGPDFVDNNGLNPFPLEVPSQSPQHAVPSPGNNIDSSNQGLYSPIHPGSAGIFNTEFVTISNGVLQVPSPGQQQSPNSPQYSMTSPGEQSVGSPPYQGTGSGGGGGCGMSPQFTQSQSPQYNQSPSPVMIVPSSSYQEGTSQLITQQYLQQQQQQQQQQLQLQQQIQLLQQEQQQIQQQQHQHHPQQQQQQQTQQLQKPQQIASQQMFQGSGDSWISQQPGVPTQPQQGLQVPEFELPDYFNLGTIGQESALMDMLDVAEKQLDFGSCFIPNPDVKLDIKADIEADYGGKKSSNSKKKRDQPLGSNQDVEELSKKLSEVHVEDSSARNRKNPSAQTGNAAQRSAPNVDVAFRVAVSAAECLQAYAATGDISLLLATHRYLLAVQNNQGDTALHTAVSNKNMEAFNKILKASEKIKPRDLLNAQNFARETALHQAVRGNEVTMVRRLVAVLGCDVSIADAQGNTPIHCAAQLPDHRCLEALLTRPVNGTRSALTQAINAFNYHGETPLHLAVISGNLECVRLLLSAGAQVHYCERKRGANPLHLAAMFGRHEIACFLLNNTRVTIEAGMFDGNTALHLAAQVRDQEMCRILLRASADPQAKNALSRRKKSSESEEEEETETGRKEEEEEEDSEEENDGYTPFDYAGQDEKIRAILRGEEILEGDIIAEAEEREVIVEKKEAPVHSTLDSGIDISVTDIQGSDCACDGEDCASELSDSVRGRLASHLSGDTWRHLAQLLDLDYMVPCWAKESSPAELLLHPDIMKTVTVEKLRDCLEVLGLKECLAVLDRA